MLIDTSVHGNGNKYVCTTYAFTDLHKVEETKHDIVDFQAGKDVGVELFGSHDRSTVNFGVRIAQFYEKSDGRMTAQASKPFKYPVYYYYGTKNINANIQAQRSFSGIGPSISWNGSTPLSSTLDEGLAFDWGANAAILFGRQKVKVDAHNETDEVIAKAYTPVIHLISTVLTNSSLNAKRSRTVIVPNVGAFAGVSYRVGGRGKIALGSCGGGTASGSAPAAALREQTSRERPPRSTPCGTSEIRRLHDRHPSALPSPKAPPLPAGRRLALCTSISSSWSTSAQPIARQRRL